MVQPALTIYGAPAVHPDEEATIIHSYAQFDNQRPTITRLLFDQPNNKIKNH